MSKIYDFSSINKYTLDDKYIEKDISYNKNCNTRERNMNAFEYIYEIPNGKFYDSGFGDITIKNQMRLGSNTRLDQKNIRNIETDRFYNTNFNYQSINISKFQYPKDTRYLNKKF